MNKCFKCGIEDSEDVQLFSDWQRDGEPVLVCSDCAMGLLKNNTWRRVVPSHEAQVQVVRDWFKANPSTSQ